MSHHARKLALLERLRALGVRLDGIEEALEAPHSKDWEDQAIEREGEEVLERLGASGQAEVARIRAALARMVRGEYTPETAAAEIDRRADRLLEKRRWMLERGGAS